MKLNRKWDLGVVKDLVSIRNGHAFKSKDFKNEPGIPVVRQTNLSTKVVNFKNEKFVPDSFLAEFEKFKIVKNDWLIGLSGSIGNLAEYQEEFISLQNQRTGLLKVKDNNHLKFAVYYLQFIQPELLKQGKGVAVQNISSKTIEAYIAPKPPYETQKRIADKLDSVLAKVEAAQARLDKIPTILKRFRQSVLASATSGELTKDWREVNDVRLKVIPKDVENDAYDVWKNTTDRDLPSSWHYFKLYELGSIQGGGTPRKSVEDYWNGKVPWVTPKDMKIDFIFTSKLKVTDFGVKNSSAKYIDKSSLLFVVRGMILAHSFPVAKTLEQVTVNQDMKALTPIEEANPDYLLYTLKSLTQVFVELASSSTHGTKRLEAKMYNNVAIPVPPLEEQFEIVEKVKQLLEHANTVEKQYNAAKARLDKLTQSILAKAFRGELITKNVDAIENEISQINVEPNVEVINE